jgi:hypothetical protein
MKRKQKPETIREECHALGVKRFAMGGKTIYTN